MRVAFLNPQGNFDRHDSYLTEHPDFGGQLVYVKELALALGRMGIEVDILTRRIEDPDWSGFEAELDAFDELASTVRIVRLDFGGPGFLAKEALWPHLGEFVEQIGAFYGDRLPDYFTAHYADGGYAGVLLRQSHGSGFTFTGHSLGAQKLDKLGLNPSNRDELESRYRFSRRIAAERLSMALADRVVTSTEAERREQYGHPLYAGAIDPSDDARFAVIPPGINTRIFNTRQETDDESLRDRIVNRIEAPELSHIVVSSRLDPKKNIAAVVSAFAHSTTLRERSRLAIFVRGIDDPWSELDRLRPGERAVLQDVLERIEAAGLRSQVCFLNLGSQRELACAYRVFGRMGSVFALPSLFEPFGLAPIEAAACGLAVAATQNGGPAEIFAGQAGVLFDPEDVASVAAGLESALEAQAELAARGAERVNQRYTWERTAERYLAVIEQAMSLPARGAGEINTTLDAGDRIAAHAERGGSNQA